MHIAIYTLTSELHDEQAVKLATDEFLGSLHIEYVFRGNDFTDYGTHALSLIYVRTGGTEGIFRKILPQLRTVSSAPFYLLASDKSNSLAASMEILSFLHLHQLRGEILHGSPSFVTQRIMLLEKVGQARRVLAGCRLGVIGKPSDWLIASEPDYSAPQQKLGIELVDVPMEELMEALSATPLCQPEEMSATEAVRDALPGANRIYCALKSVVKSRQLQGFTLRCFDLLKTVHNTGCLALAKLNAEGIVAGCEGDVPAMLSMMIVRSLLDVSGFQANPSRINPETGEILFAHCTIPLDMVERFELDTHFESGIGVGIRGFMKEGPVTIFKVSADLKRHFVAEGQLVCSQAHPGLCRTQQIIHLKDKSQAAYFLNEPIGNHHIILPGHQQALLEEIVASHI